jgi:hypothetical protein
MYDFSRNDRLAALLIFAALLFGGAALVVFAVKDFGAARASASWPTTEAIVLSGPVGPNKVRYVYTVEGVNYESRRVRFVTASLGAPAWRAPRPGTPILVAVDPQDPRASAAAPGGTAILFAIFTAVGGLCVFVGLAGVIRAATAVEEPVLVFEAQSQSLFSERSAL